MQKNSSIIYVNFAQYDNTGRILDFLRQNFYLVAHFSYDHLRLKTGRANSYLRVYKKGVLVNEVKLINLRVPPPLLFPSLALVAISMILQTLIYSYKLKRKYKKFDYYLTLNGFSAWIGNILRSLQITNKTIFWVGDYFPINFPDWRIKMARWIYWKFDQPSMKNADKLVFTNDKLLRLYKKMGFLKSKKCFVVPIGTSILMKIPTKKTPLVGFLGMIKNTQGLQLIFDALPQLKKLIPGLKIEIVGSGPDEDTYRNQAKKYSKVVKFYGFIEDQNKIQKIVSRWSVGIATYLPDKSNESYWGDPSKIKVYLSVGVPTITTNVSYMSDIIKEKKAGMVIDYDSEKLTNSIINILKYIKQYEKNAFGLAKEYNYKLLYPKVFSNKY